MDIEKMIDDIIPDKKAAGGCDNNYSDMPLRDLLLMEVFTDELTAEIFDRFTDDIKSIIDDFLKTSVDPHAGDGMYKCSLETWQTCAGYIGRNYFIKNKYLKDVKKIAAAGGVAYKDELLCIGLAVYENFCNMYRKQFFIYDCCMFLGLSMQTMYRLSELHGEMLKIAHSKQESSMRSALASGRSNVTAMAILLNHDYDYTRTTQVIHTSNSNQVSADRLPDLGQTQYIEDTKKTAGTDYDAISL